MSSSFGKGKRLEIANPIMGEYHNAYQTVSTEDPSIDKEAIRLPHGQEKGKSVTGDELRVLREEMARINTQIQANNDFAYNCGKNTNEGSGIVTPRAMYKPFDFNGDSDPLANLNQCILTP